MSNEKLEKHWKKCFDYNYAGSYSLPMGKNNRPGKATVCISKVEFGRRKVQNEDKEILLIHFYQNDYGINVPMIVNKTNAERLERLAQSPIPSDWKDMWITLESERVKAFGEVHDALRVSTIKASAPKPLIKRGDERAEDASKFILNHKTEREQREALAKTKARYELDKDLEQWIVKQFGSKKEQEK